MKRHERVVRSSTLPLAFKQHMQDTYGLKSAQVHRTIPTQMPKKRDGVAVLAILGRSGMGKTASLRNIQSDDSKWINNLKWEPHLPLMSQVHSDPIEASKLLNAVGLRSMPVWLLPFKDLSTGQQARARMTRALVGNDVSVIDEFGSTIDPLTRQCMALTFQKAVRARNRRVAVAVNDERILQFLKPDRVFDVNSGDWKHGMTHSKVPMTVTLCLADAKTTTALWKRLKYEHYLSSHIGMDCAAFSIHLKSPHIPQLEHPVGLVVVNCIPGWKDSAERSDVRYVHRLVIDSAVQGVKIGSVAIDLLGALFANRKMRLKCITSHHSMISHLERSRRWNFKESHVTSKRHASNPNVTPRTVRSFEYVGPSHKTAPSVKELACSGCPRAESFSASVGYTL